MLSIAGNLTEEQAIAIAQKYFEDKYASDVPYENVPVAARPAHSHACKRKKDIEQTHIAFAFPSYPYNDIRGNAMQLMTIIFSMEMSSRLFQSVREKLGLCYTIYGYPSSYQNNGAFIVYTSTSPNNAEKAVEAIRDEINLLIEKGVSDEELNKGKEQVKTALVLGQESTSAMMRTFGAHAVQTGQLYDFDERIKNIDAVTKEDVQKPQKRFSTFRKCARQ